MKGGVSGNKSKKKNRQSGKKRGKYYGKEHPLKNPKCNRLVRLLMMGENTRKKIEENDYKITNWDNRYKKDLKRIGVIKELDPYAYRLEYTFLWDVFLKEMVGFLKDDLKKTKDELKTYKTYVKGNGIDTSEKLKNFINHQKINPTLPDDSLKYRNLYLKRQELKRKGVLSNEMEREIDKKVKRVDAYREEIKELFTKTGENNRNWFICTLFCYFRELEWMRQGMKDFEEESIYNQFMDFCLALSSDYYDYELKGEKPAIFRQYPYNLRKVKIRPFKDIFRAYNDLRQLNMNWLIALKPHNEAILKREAEEMKDRYDEGMAKAYEEVVS